MTSPVVLMTSLTVCNNDSLLMVSLILLRMVGWSRTVAVVCQLCCIDIDQHYTGSDDVTSSRDDVTDSVCVCGNDCHLMYI